MERFGIDFLEDFKDDETLTMMERIALSTGRTVGLLMILKELTATTSFAHDSAD